MPPSHRSAFLVSMLIASAAAAVAAPAHDAGDRHRELLAELAARRRAASPYIVIDTHGNRVVLRDAQHRVLRQARAATGAARRFEGPKRRHRWRFATPTGRFQVLRKEEDPLWVKPEWAFLEAGEEIPVFAEDPRRFQRGVLGRYAIYFLQDYMIHGTLYEINLGRNITHGCVRLGDEDLSALYERVQTGWPVFVF